MLVIDIYQLHLMTKAVGRIFIVRKDKVEDTNRIDALEIEVPYTFLPLVLDGESGVKDTPVLEKLLFSLLHLNNKRLTLLILTIDIKDGPAVTIAIAEVLTIEIGKISHYFLTFEKRVEKTNQQIFVERRTKELLKTEVRVRIDIPGTRHLLYIV